MTRRVDIAFDGFWRGYLRAMPVPMSNGYVTQGRDYMNLERKHLLQLMAQNFDVAYKAYLDVEGLADNPNNKVAFYAMAELIVVDDEFPDPVIQEALLDHIADVITEAADNELHKIELIIQEASATSAQN